MKNYFQEIENKLKAQIDKTNDINIVIIETIKAKIKLLIVKPINSKLNPSLI